MREKTVDLRELKRAKYYYPFAYLFRSGAALKLGNAAINDDRFLQDASRELEIALYDKSPELLVLAVMVNLKIGNDVIAQKYYDIFKQVDKRSYLIDFIKAKK